MERGVIIMYFVWLYYQEVLSFLYILLHHILLACSNDGSAGLSSSSLSSVMIVKERRLCRVRTKVGTCACCS